MTKTTRTTTTMTRIEVTHSAPRLNAKNPGVRASKGSEVWAARSVDGTWTYRRSEEPGTPWLVCHEPTGYVDYFNSLPKARRWTASDQAIPGIRRVLIARRLRPETEMEAGRQLVLITALTVLAA